MVVMMMMMMTMMMSIERSISKREGRIWDSQRDINYEKWDKNCLCIYSLHNTLKSKKHKEQGTIT